MAFSSIATASFKEQPMQLFSWLHKRMTSLPHAPRTSARKPTRRFRPQLEALEDRWLPSTLTVTTNLDSGPGSLRAEIAAANPGDTINFAPSLDGQTITLTSGELGITKNLTIQGPGAGQLTVSGGNTSRVFEVGANTYVSLSGLTITQGNSQAYGGGGIDNNGSLTVSGCALSGNSAWYYGGGIYNSGTLTVSGSTLTGNSSLNGGGIYNNFGSVTINNSTLSANTAYGMGTGGGIANEGGTLTVENSTLSGNTVLAGDGGGCGGAVYNWDGTVTMSGCTLSGNSAFDGGALFTYDYVATNHKPVGTMTITGCTVTGNSAWAYGGGFENYGSSGSALKISNSVFSNNETYFYGSWLTKGMYVYSGRWTNGGGNTFS
jgi:hypothetical protein